MTEIPPTLDAAGRHPRVVGLGETDAEQRRASAFARDLSRFLWGAPRELMGPLARVVTLVAASDFRDARVLCEGRPLLAVEAAARATEVLWPLLRWPEPPEGAEPEAGAGQGSGKGEGEDDEEAGDPAAVLAALADGEVDEDPELEALAERLRQLGAGDDPVQTGEVASDLLEGFGEQASSGAIEADEVARHLENFLPGVGWSSAPGELERTLLEKLDGLATLIRKLPELREIAERLGRLESESRKPGLMDGGSEEVAGVVLSGDITRALPAELALLADPDTEDLFHQRWVEHRLISLELVGRGDEGRSEGEKRGPVIACIDTSASMEGDPELVAKAVVLAVCRQALPRGRTVHLLLFGGPGERTEIRVRRGRGGLEGLLAFLEMGFHGGTDFDGPLLRAVELLAERDLLRADLLVVTDGLGRAAPRVVEEVDACKEARGVRVWSVVIGRDDVRSVKAFSDEVWVLKAGEEPGRLGLGRVVGR